MKKFYLLTLIFLLIGALSVSADLRVYPVSPFNNSKLNTQQPDLGFYFVSSVNATAFCELYVSEDTYGVNGSVLNNTVTFITVNESLGDLSSHRWSARCNDGLNNSFFGDGVLNYAYWWHFDVDESYIRPSLFVDILSPSDTEVINDTNYPNVSFYFESSNSSSASCRVYIDGIGYSGINSSVINYTITTIEINNYLNDTESYDLFVSCDDGFNIYNSSSIEIEMDFYSEPVLNIISYYPENNTPFYEENTTVLFNITDVEGGVGAYSFEWFLDGVSQALTQWWYWVIGYSDAGVHNITGFVYDEESPSNNDSVSWIATVNNTFLEPSAPTSLFPSEGDYDYLIPISCQGSEAFNGDNEVLYQVDFSVDGSGFMPLFNNTLGTGFMDMAWINYGSEVYFRCKTYDSDGLPSAYLYSSNITRTKRFEFRLFNPSVVSYYLPGQIYQFGLFGDVSLESGVRVESIYLDCNGDGLWDYYTDNSTTEWLGLSNVTVFQEYFSCIFPNADVTIQAGMTMVREGGWADSSFSGCKNLIGDSCRIIKNYRVDVL